MLLDNVTKAYIICYCEPSGSGNSVCNKGEKVDIQEHCSFFIKASYADSCSNIRHGEYCGCFHASDFALGKDIHIENISNPPKIKGHPISRPNRSKTYIDTQRGIREIRSPYPGTIEKVVKKIRKQSYPDLLEQHLGAVERHKTLHKQIVDNSPMIFKEDCGESMSEVMGEYEEWERKHDNSLYDLSVEANPCEEVSIAIDNSGAMTAEKFQELASDIADALETGRLNWTRPINVFMDMSELKELMDGLCCAYSSKYGLYLDMSDLDIYTIYKRDGYFISLRDLYKDNIYPMDLNFKMIDGRNQEDIDFLPFLEMVPKMLNSGR